MTIAVKIRGRTTARPATIGPKSPHQLQTMKEDLNKLLHITLIYPELYNLPVVILKRVVEMSRTYLK